MKRYLMVVFLCVIAAAGWIYDRDIRRVEARPAVEAGRDDSRTDCNVNGVADEDEMHPLPGQALAFDGDGDYVDPGASEALADLAQGDFTIEAWIRTDDPGHAILVGNAGAAPRLYNFVIRGHDEGGVIRLRTVDGETSHVCDGAVTIADGAWHHVAAARWINGPGCIRLYVDGEEIGTLWGDYDMTPFTADNATLIGRDQQSSPHYFNGAMDEVRVWNVGRFMDEIKADMYRVLDGDEPGLVAYWRFDEGTGSVAHDSTGDSDGALVGSPAWAPFGYDCNNNGVLDKCDAIVDGVIYVDDDATGGLKDGLSWANAFVDLQDALACAACDSRVTEIRVAEGTYKPGWYESDSFHPVNGVALRGGYRGLAGGGDPDDRDIDAFESILSGDVHVIGDPDDNCRHVVVCENVDESTVIEGFKITEGNASGPVEGDEYGGGMYIAEGANPTIARCKFVANRAESGGGIYNDFGRPTLTECTFSGNSAAWGGAMYGGGLLANTVTIANCTFSGNSADGMGGGIFYASGTVELTNCTFSGNSAGTHGGAAAVDHRSLSMTFVNCTFSGNSAGTLGGVLFSVLNNYLSVHAVNCVLWGNTADFEPQMAAGADVAFSCVEGGYAGAGNIDADPLFVDADGPDGIHGTADDDLHLLEGSPCINTGDDESISESVTIDLDGEPRVQQCHVDMGAYETPYFIEDCNSNDASDECDIENCDGSPWCGDCNENGAPDECDIAGGTSQDCNENGIPDECEPLPGGVIYVDDGASSGLDNGLSWADAFMELRDALTYAACDSRITEIHVAGGTYKPGAAREDSFLLQNSLALRGGYRGLAGGGEPDDRDIDAFESILSGDIGVNGDTSDNCYNVVLGNYTDATAEIEGFTITGGKDERTYPLGRGGGIFIGNGSPTIAHCTISDNSANNGGGVSLWQSNSTISHCTINANTAIEGGGMYIYASSPTVTGCTFSNNRGDATGGGMSNVVSHPTLTECTFSGNVADVSGGGLYSTHTTNDVTAANCTFSGNSANEGGGLYYEVSQSLTLVNCTFSGNSASVRGGGIVNGEDSYNALAANCILWSNTAASSPQICDLSGLTVTHTCIQGGWEGDSNIDADPLFVDADGPDGVFGTDDDDVHLLGGSPCINAGDDEAIPAGVTTDFEGDPRIIHCGVDMGADETPHLRADCNNNGESDDCDIASGASEDENGDGVPDECGLFGDCDFDLDVDLDDLEAMLGCLFGPDETPSEGCECGNGNADLDVDVADFALFQQAFTGSQP